MIEAVRRAVDARYPLVAGIVLEALAIWFVHWIDTRGYIDTEIYRLGATAWLNGWPVYEGDLTPVSSPDSGTLPFIYPPITLALFTPLTRISSDTAVVTVALISHLAILVTAYSFARSSHYTRSSHYNGTSPTTAVSVAAATALLMPLITLTEPGRETLNYGQINLILMALVAADCLLPQPLFGKLRWPRGLLVGLAAAIKLTPLAFLLLFLLRKDFHAVATSALTFGYTVVIGFFIAPRDSVTWWLEEMISTGDSFNTIYTGNLNLRALIAKQGVTATTLDSMWLIGSVLLLGLAILGIHYALRVDNQPLALLTNAVLALLVSPISWSHHWVWVGPGLGLLFVMALRHRRYLGLTVLVMCAAVMFIGPQWYLPYGDEQELDWTFTQQIYGNAYTLIAMGFLVGMAVAWVRFHSRGRASTDSVTEGSLSWA